jgi:hypothetical protein
MNFYENLPIYKLATELAVRMDKVVREFSRFHKYTLGARLRDSALDLVLLVARANRREERVATLDLLCRQVEELKVLMNLGKELQAFQSFREFAQLMEQVVNIARQAEGWRKKSLPAGVRPEPGVVRRSEARP